MPENCKFGIITALISEAESLPINKPYPTVVATKINRHSVLLISGIGAKYASYGITKLKQLEIDKVICWGLAGGLDQSVKAGDLVIPKQVSDGKSTITINRSWQNNVYKKIQAALELPDWPDISAHKGTLLSSKDIVNSVVKKRQLNLLGASYVDMESYTLAECAQKLDIDLIVIKSIVDDCFTAIPELINECIDKYGQPKLLKLMIKLLQEPANIPRILKLASYNKHAINSLKLVQKILLDNYFYHPQHYNEK